MNVCMWIDVIAIQVLFPPTAKYVTANLPLVYA